MTVIEVIKKNGEKLCMGALNDQTEVKEFNVLCMMSEEFIKRNGNSKYGFPIFPVVSIWLSGDEFKENLELIEKMSNHVNPYGDMIDSKTIDHNVLEFITKAFSKTVNPNIIFESYKDFITFGIDHYYKNENGDFVVESLFFK